jgi:hypothetical protein
MDHNTLPRRLTTSQVCELAGYSKKTLRRRRRAGLIKLEPVDRGRQHLFGRDDVLAAFGMAAGRPVESQWKIDPAAFQAARKRKPRQN